MGGVPWIKTQRESQGNLTCKTGKDWLKLGTRHLSSHSGLERHILMISGGLRKAGVEHLGFRRVRKVILSFFYLFSSLCLSRGLAFPLSVLLGPRDLVP